MAKESILNIEVLPDLNDMDPTDSCGMFVPKINSDKQQNKKTMNDYLFTLCQHIFFSSRHEKAARRCSG